MRPCAAPAIHARRALTLALLAATLAACGGGGDPAVPARVPVPAGHATAQAIDAGTDGDATDLRLARSARGDAIAAWRNRAGAGHTLWANRYDSARDTWGRAIRVDRARTDVDDFDLAVDAAGGAVLVWHEAREDGAVSGVGRVSAARRASGTAGWSAPEQLSGNAVQPRVAGSADGRMLAVYVGASVLVRGRFLEPASGAWQAEEEIEQNRSGTGFSSDPVAWVEDDGDALAAFANLRTGASVLASNLYAHAGGGWQTLPPGDSGSIGTVPGSFEVGESHHLELVATGDGGFLLAWETAPLSPPPEVIGIRVARHAGPAAGWTRARILVPGDGQRNARLQRLAGDGQGHTWLLWTEHVGGRAALLAWPIDDGGAACGAVQVLDAAVGGGAAHADLAVAPGGQALAVWQQFEGGHADDGSRSNVAFTRFDSAGHTDARLAEALPGAATSPRASIAAGRALLGWVQVEDGRGRVKVDSVLLH